MAKPLQRPSPGKASSSAKKTNDDKAGGGTTAKAPPHKFPKHVASGLAAVKQGGDPEDQPGAVDADAGGLKENTPAEEAADRREAAREQTAAVQMPRQRFQSKSRARLI
jgi:hypothetical protein